MTTDKEKSAGRTRRSIKTTKLEPEETAPRLARRREPEKSAEPARDKPAGTRSGAAKELVSSAKKSKGYADGYRRSAPRTSKRTSYVSDKNKSSERQIRKNDAGISSAAKAFIRVVAVVFAIVFIVTMWISFSGWTFSESVDSIRLSAKDSSAMRSGTGKFPVPLSGTLAVKAEKLAGGTAVLTDTSLTVYNKKGGVAINSPHYMANPAMRTNGHYALVYDIGGVRFRVETASGTMATGKTESSIVCASIAKCGRYVIVSEESTRLSQVYVYDSDGNALFGWHSADYYINSVALSDNGRYLTVCGLNASEGVICSAVIVFSIDDNAEIARKVFEDELLLDVEYTKSGCAIAVGEKEVVCVSDDAKKIESTSLGNKVCAYDIDHDSGAAVCVSDIDCAIVSAFDTKGRQRFTAKTDDTVTDVSMSGDHVCVLLQGTVQTFDLSGEPEQTFESVADANRILTLGDRAYIMCNTVLRMEEID